LFGGQVRTPFYHWTTYPSLCRILVRDLKGMLAWPLRRVSITRMVQKPAVARNRGFLNYILQAVPTSPRPSPEGHRRDPDAVGIAEPRVMAHRPTPAEHSICTALRAITP